MTTEAEAAQKRKLPGVSRAERRASGPRRRFLLIAKVETPHRVIKVKLRDLSTGGARVEGPIDDLLGRSVVLTSHSLNARARVAWFSDYECGLRFDYPQETDMPFEKKASEPVSHWRGMNLSVFKRPAVSKSSLSAIEEQFVKLWGCERP